MRAAAKLLNFNGPLGPNMVAAAAVRQKRINMNDNFMLDDLMNCLDINLERAKSLNTELYGTPYDAFIRGILWMKENGFSILDWNQVISEPITLYDMGKIWKDVNYTNIAETPDFVEKPLSEECKIWVDGDVRK
jgi:hypothetical protein